MVKNSFCVFTDSGGIQEETSYLGVKCFTIRENTERPSTIINGTNTLISSKNYDKNFDWINEQVRKSPKKTNIELWDGKASKRICEEFFKFINNN